mmetsp:Transcript_34554/g.95176  ORF Transcript_34554/g.95176 Transcript_34554/m.95176 type:complete len:286 (-) Transcript_34554:6-863(-)
MNFKLRNEPITYGVPLHEVESEDYIDGVDNFIYPSADASYPVGLDDAVSLIDQDFCDVIDALAEFDDNALAWGHSPVAMPILSASNEENPPFCPNIPVQYAVPKNCVNPSNVKVVPAKAVRAIDIDDNHVLATAEYCNLDDFTAAKSNINGDLYFPSLSAEEKKIRRIEALERWKRKRNARKQKIFQKSQSKIKKTKQLKVSGKSNSLEHTGQTMSCVCFDHSTRRNFHISTEDTQYLMQQLDSFKLNESSNYPYCSNLAPSSIESSNVKDNSLSNPFNIKKRSF